MLIPAAGDRSPHVRPNLRRYLVADVLLGGALVGALLFSIAVLAGPGETLHLPAPRTELAFYPEDLIAEPDVWHEAVISANVTPLVIGILLGLPTTIVQLRFPSKDKRNVVAAKAH